MHRAYLSAWLPASPHRCCRDGPYDATNGPRRGNAAPVGMQPQANFLCLLVSYMTLARTHGAASWRALPVLQTLGNVAFGPRLLQPDHLSSRVLISGRPQASAHLQLACTLSPRARDTEAK